MKISMDYVNDNTFKVQNQSNNELLIDMCDPDKKNHLSPMELLLSAVTSCAAVRHAWALTAPLPRHRTIGKS